MICHFHRIREHVEPDILAVQQDARGRGAEIQVFPVDPAPPVVDDRFIDRPEIDIHRVVNVRPVHAHPDLDEVDVLLKEVDSGDREGFHHAPPVPRRRERVLPVHAVVECSALRRHIRKVQHRGDVVCRVPDLLSRVDVRQADIRRETVEPYESPFGVHLRRITDTEQHVGVRVRGGTRIGPSRITDTHRDRTARTLEIVDVRNPLAVVARNRALERVRIGAHERGFPAYLE